MSSTDYGTNPDSPLGGDERFRPMPFVWRCAVCLRRQEFSGDVPDQYARENWPKCCGLTVLPFLAECEPGRKG